MNNSEAWSIIKNQFGNPDNLSWKYDKGRMVREVQKLQSLQQSESFLGSFAGYDFPQQKQKRIMQNPLVRLVRSYPAYKGDIIRSTYEWVNPQIINQKNFKVMAKQFSKNNTLAFPVRMEDGRIEVKTIKAQNLNKLASNNFTFNTQEIGSDANYSENATIDFSRRFFVTEIKQRSQLSGNCNSKKQNARSLKYCNVIDPYTKHRNCFFQCLKLLGLKHDVPMKDQGGITPQQALIICQRNGLPIEIILDEIDEIGQLKSIVKTQNHDNHQQIVMAMKDNKPHYYVFVNRCISKQEIKQQKIDDKLLEKENGVKQKIDVYYDLETIFDHNDEYMAKTYSCSFLPMKSDEIYNEITEKNIGWFKEQCQFFIGQKVCEQMIDFLCRQYDTKLYYFRFISFNGSNFDDYFLLQQAVRNGENIQAVYQTKSILSLRFQYGQCWDLRKFLTCGSLDYLCSKDAFDVFPKKIKGYSHEEPQTAFEENRLEQWINDNLSTIQEYNKTDVLALYSLTKKFRGLILEMTKTDVFDFATIGTHSFKLCKKRWNKDLQQLLKSPITEDDDLFVRKCLTAGRSQVMGSKNGEPVHLKGQRLSMIDVVSLYPFVMMNKLNYFPCGDYQYVSQRNNQKLGFYHIKVQQKEDIPNVLPLRCYDDPQIPLNWNCKEEFETYCTSIDLDVLEQFKNSFTIIKGLEFNHKISGDIIFQSLLPFKEEKIKQDAYKEIYQPAKSRLYNNAMRETCKIYLNSLSGKVIQRNFDNITVIIRSRKEFHQFLDQCQDGSASIHFAGNDFIIGNGKKQIDKKYNRKSAKPSYLGVYIYSHARKYMYENIYSIVDSQYTDTDSDLCTYSEELKLRKMKPQLFEKIQMEIDGQMFLIKDFGTLDCELKENANEAILLQSKCYFVGNRDDKYFAKIKCKGVSFKNTSCKYLPNTYEGNSINQQQYRKIEQTLQQNPLKLFDDLLNYGKVKVACQQLVVKSLRHDGSKFGVALRYIVKQIKIKQ